MSSPPPDLVRWQRRQRAASLLSAAAVTAAAIMALLPPAGVSLPAEPERVPAADAVKPAAPAAPEDHLNLAAFDAPIWTFTAAAPAAAPAPSPAPPPPPLPPVPPPPPPRLQFLAVEDASPRRAIFYDPDRDRIFSGAAGEIVAGFRIVDVATQRVVLARHDAQHFELALHADRPPPRTRGGRP